MNQNDYYLLQWTVSLLTFFATCAAIAIGFWQYTKNHDENKKLKRNELVVELYTQDSALLQTIAAEPDSRIARLLLRDTEGLLFAEINRQLKSGDAREVNDANGVLAKCHIHYSKIGNLLEAYLLLRDGAELEKNVRAAWDGYIRSYHLRSKAFVSFMEKSHGDDYQTWTDDFYRAFFPADDYRVQFPNK